MIGRTCFAVLQVKTKEDGSVVKSVVDYQSNQYLDFSTETNGHGEKMDLCVKGKG